jgi:hypothetical protein
MKRSKEFDRMWDVPIPPGFSDKTPTKAGRYTQLGRSAGAQPYIRFHVILVEENGSLQVCDKDEFPLRSLQESPPSFWAEGWV